MPGHPLTARVQVNRIWQHAFGAGLVKTAEDFGVQSEFPVHKDLLDWLAVEFRERGWGMKAMHRLILTSSTYRQASRTNPAAQAAAMAVDPEVRLLWRQRLRRLEAEPLRDAIVAVSGMLYPQMFGAPVPVQRTADGEIVTPAAAGDRRSLYYLVRRSEPLSFLQALDQPVMETNCTRRANATVSSQALTALNSDFVVRQAELFAARAAAA